MKVRVTWDTDGEEVHLPEIVQVPPHVIEESKTDDGAIADWLSGKYDWLVQAVEPLEERPTYAFDILVANMQYLRQHDGLTRGQWAAIAKHAIHAAGFQDNVTIGELDRLTDAEGIE